jgi:hypothetical protein
VIGDVLNFSALSSGMRTEERERSSRTRSHTRHDRHTLPILDEPWNRRIGATDSIGRAERAGAIRSRSPRSRTDGVHVVARCPRLLNSPTGEWFHPSALWIVSYPEPIDRLAGVHARWPVIAPRSRTRGCTNAYLDLGTRGRNTGGNTASTGAPRIP